MKPRGDEYFYNVQGLLVPRSGGNVGLESILQNIDLFLGLVQGTLDRMEQMLDEGKIRYFVERMELMRETLDRIFARKLSADADSILSSCRLKHLDVAQKQFFAFKSEAMGLAINIERAKIQNEKPATNIADDKTMNREIANYAEIISNLNAVKYFIDHERNEEAIGILMDMETVKDHPTARGVIMALREADQEMAMSLLQCVIIEYAQAIIAKSSGDTDIKKKVLAVDDRPEILTTLGGVLEEHFQVYGAPSGEKALKIMQRHTIDLFILDIEMPVMDGIRLAGIIKETDTYRNTPVIFLTGNATREYVVKACEAGAVDFIVKPVVKDTLLAKIRQHLY